MRVETPNYFSLRDYLPVEWNRDHFVITGSACLAVRGVRDVRDLDLLIRPVLWASVRKLYARDHWPKGDPESDEPHLLCTGRIDFFDTPPRIAEDVGVDAIFEAADVYDGYKIISLRHCLAVKALANRIKDLDDMVNLATLIRTEETK